ncbi:MAG: hypothetical protein ACOYN2_03885 [Patescibacteria group bacterium]
MIAPTGEDTLLSSMAYQDVVLPRSVQMTNFVANGQRNTTTYYDGLGRTIQNRTSAFEIGKSWVTDTRYNSLDLPEFASYPYQADGFLYARPAQAFSGATIAYDGLGRMLKTTDARGIMQQEYFPKSRKITDRLGNPKVLNFDIKDQLIEVQEFAGSGAVYSTRYAYTPLGQLMKYTDALGNFRTLKYDGLGRLTELTDLVNSGSSVIPARHYVYNELGNIIQETDQANNTKQYTYDVL